MSPDDYPAGLWPWERCHVAYGGTRHTARVRGYFIRRYEFDDFLLRESGADLLTDRGVKRAVRHDDGTWVLDDALRAPYVIGAGGTHCPIARAIAERRPKPPVGVQEREFLAGAAEVADTRVGEDGEPELLIHDDLRGYSWNVPKSDWLNVGSGTVSAREVRAAWQRARGYFEREGHLPPSAAEELERVQGHSYYLFHPHHLQSCHKGGALLVGDALGLAHPITAEGIYPGILSARIAADALRRGEPERYRERLEAHPAIANFEVVFHAREWGARLASRGGGRRADTAQPQRGGRASSGVSRIGRAALAHGFAHLFAGGVLPGAKLARHVAKAAARAVPVESDSQAPPPASRSAG